MEELEAAVIRYLKLQLGDLEYVEIRLRDLRDTLAPEFISDGYPLSAFNAEVRRIINRLWRNRRILGRTAVGVYLYGPEDRLPRSPELIEKIAYRLPEVPRGYDLAPVSSDLTSLSHFGSIANLASSKDFLIVHELPNRELDFLDGLSF